MSDRPSNTTTAADNDQAEIDASLAVLRTGTAKERIAARDTLGRIFERRGLLDHAAECYEANVLDGVRDPLLYERLAGIYDRQGDADRATEARAEARKLMERRARAARRSTPIVATPPPGPATPPLSIPPASPSTFDPNATFQMPLPPPPPPGLLPPYACVPPTLSRKPHDDPLGSLVHIVLALPPSVFVGGAIVIAALGAFFVVFAATLALSRPTSTTGVPTAPQIEQLAEATPDAVRADPTVAALMTQVAQIQATADAGRSPTDPTPVSPAQSQLPTGDVASGAATLRSVAAFVVTNTGSGSGVSLGGGRFITNHHVVDDASTVAVRLVDGRTSQATVLRVDPTRDLALLDTRLTNVPAATLRNSADLQSAEPLYVVGYPLGTKLGIEEITFTRGIFSARRQTPNGVWYVQTDATMNHGNSGGPVGDANGNVVGVATFGLRDSNGLNFAVASDEIRAFLDGGGVAPPPARAQPPAVSAPGVAAVPVAPVVPARPELLGAAFGPSTIEPGGAVVIGYEITNAGTVPVTVILGASIRLGNNGWINDTTSDATVRIAPGRNTYNRQFRIPASAAAGRYDLWVSVLGEDYKTTYGQRSAPDSLIVAARQQAAPAVQAVPSTSTSVPAPTARPVPTSTPLPPPTSPTQRAPASQPSQQQTGQPGSAPIVTNPIPNTPAAKPTVAPTATRSAPTSTPQRSNAFDPSRFVGQGNRYDCDDFASQAQAQAVLRADPNDPNKLDQGGTPGVACESNPPPRDLAPVRRR